MFGKLLNHHRFIIVIIILFLALSTTYSVVTPIFEASDELWHYPMVKYIADHWSLPVQDPQNVGPWRQEGSQPPLYYIIGALATAWIDTSDMAEVRWLNPHVDNGLITEDGNTNLVIHSSREAFPWRGTVLAVHLVRLLSVLMGAGTVLFTYLTARELLPDREDVALGAAVITAFNPSHVLLHQRRGEQRQPDHAPVLAGPVATDTPPSEGRKLGSLEACLLSPPLPLSPLPFHSPRSDSRSSGPY